MRLLFLFVTVMTTWMVSGQSFDRFKLADTELPKGYKFTNKILCQAVQPRIFFENPDLYQAILGKVRNKDFQSFESKDDTGTVLFFEYEEKVEGKGFLDGLLWGGNKPTKEHPEEYIIKDNILIIWSFNKKSVVKDISKKKVQGAAADKKQKLVWADEFNTAGQPDTTKWNYDLGDGCPNVCGWGNNELEYYTKDSKNVRIENGSLIIEAHKDSLGGKAYTSTRIVSKGKGDWLYGRIEIKAKLPRGKGTWPAIWMLSTEWKYGGWPESGEIDIMEHVGFDPGVVHGTLHSDKYNHVKQTQQEGKITVADAQDTFHVYAVEWEVNEIRFFVDDKMYHTVKRNPQDDFNGWPFDQKFHLIMNVAVGGNWGGMQGVDESIWPQRMEVDYVRVYQ